MEKIKDNAVAITATAKGVIYHNNPRKVVKYTVKLKQEDVRTKENRPQKVEIDKIFLNLIQRQMYRRLMYGMKEYDKKQILSMSTYTIKKIEEDFKKAKRAIHVLKAKKCFHAETKLISAIFNRKDIGKYDHDWFVDIPKNYTLRKLGISTKDVIDDFIKRRLLPKDFYKITPENVKL
tara:strand:- start:261 stop:794 length:534 start_codon:yes stop_codon:yes gene_type:complete